MEIEFFFKNRKRKGFFFAEIKKGKKERIFSENPERKGKMRTRAISNKTQIKTHNHNFFIVPKRRMHPDEVFLG
jgi:hypothetical protein